jgi:3D (Asp-Asp-Asp) domain-containing protein
VIELVVGAAAIWFVAHPRRLPSPLESEPLPDTTAAVSAAGPAPDAATREPAGLPPEALNPRDTNRTTRNKSRLLPTLALPSGRLFRSIEERARAHERVAITFTAYCLQGITRSGRPVRDGVIAVDRALFPLGRAVDLFVGTRKLGRYQADDTGRDIRGARIDIWMPSCSDARRFGRRRGYAQLLPVVK